MKGASAVAEPPPAGAQAEQTDAEGVEQEVEVQVDGAATETATEDEAKPQTQPAPEPVARYVPGETAFVINRESFLEALVMAQPATTRGPKPVLQCVKIAASPEGVTVSATNLELYLVIHLDAAQVEKAGTVVVHAEQLRETIKRMGEDDTVKITESDDGLITITGTSGRFRIYGQSPDAFPPQPDDEQGEDFEIDSAALATAIDRTDFCISKDQTRYAMSAVLMELDGRKLHVVATDGRRLALARTELEKKGSAKRIKALVPTSAVTVIQKVLGGREGNVQVTATERHAFFRVDKVSIATTLQEGQFPPYEDVIPKEPSRKFTVDTQAYRAAIDRAGLYTTEESKGVRFDLNKKGLVITARSPDVGEAECHVAGRLEGMDLAIGFNPALWLDALRVVADTPEVVVEFSAANRPALLRAGADFLYVLMPVNLS